MAAKPDYWEVDEDDHHHLVCPSCDGINTFETYEEYHKHYRSDHLDVET